MRPEADQFYPSDVISTPRGDILLDRRAPESMAADRGAPDWFGISLSVGLWIGEKLITPAGYVLITAIASQNGVEEETSKPIEVGATLPLANSSENLAGHPDGALKKHKAEAFAEDLEAARFFAESSLAESTRRAYESDWRRFCEWCRDRRHDFLPAEPRTVAVFIASEARHNYAPSTISRRVAAIGYFHTAKGLPSPQSQPGIPIKAVLGGIRREKSVRVIKKRPLTPDLLALLVAEVELTRRAGWRDRALLLFGFASAMRSAELAALNVEDLEFIDGGVVVTIDKSKGDQEGIGRTVSVPKGSNQCPVTALKDWMAEAKMNKGPLFRRLSKTERVLDAAIGSDYIRVLVKSYAAAAGLDPAEFGAHSLRRGWMTAAARNQGSLKDLMDQVGHKSQLTALGYIEAEQGFENHPGKGLL